MPPRRSFWRAMTPPDVLSLLVKKKLVTASDFSNRFASEEQLRAWILQAGLPEHDADGAVEAWSQAFHEQDLDEALKEEPVEKKDQKKEA